MKRTQPFIAIVGIGLLILLFFRHSELARAQSNTPPSWSPPDNLSQSGSASDPILLVDSEGKFHAIWLDAYAGYIHRQGNGETWEAPQTMNTPVPSDALKWYFLITPNGRLTAFWINADDELYTSNVKLQDIATLESWAPPILWSSTVQNFVAILDKSGGLQLAYVRGETSDAFPAGIYVAHNTNGEEGWSDPNLLYASPYFRSILAADTHLTMVSANSGNETLVYVAWDNRSRQNLWFARSADQGNQWDEPTELVRPLPSFGFDIPYDIEITAYRDQVLTLWKLGIPGKSCTTYFNWTTDRGNTWETTRQLFEPQVGCPQDSHLLITPNGEIVLFTRLNSLAYLLAWDGTTWSLPLYQPEFSSFFDPDTLRSISLQSLNLIEQNNALYLIASTPDQGGDIWITHRDLQDRAGWLASVSAWSNPQEIASETRPLRSNWLVADSKGNLHAFWNQINGNETNQRTIIFYAIWNGSTWSKPVDIIASQFRNTLLHSVAVSSQDTIYVIWEGQNILGLSEGLFISWANDQEAFSASAWVSSDPLPTLNKSATSPQIYIDAANQFWINYVIPLNEERGVHTLLSTNNGRSWSASMVVADAVAQAWPMVENPHIAVSTAGSIISLWTVSTLPPDSRPLALYAARSDDTGQTWSEPELVADGWIAWSQVQRTSDGVLHRMWIEKDQAINYIWHQFSNDDGLTWSIPNNLSTTTADLPGVTTCADGIGRLHLLVITEESGSTPIMRHWIWQNEQWMGDITLNLAFDISLDPDSLASALTSQGILGVTYASMPLSLADGDVLAHLYFTHHAEEASQVIATQTPSANLPALPTPTSVVVTPSPTPTPQDISPQPSPTSLPPTARPQINASPGNPWLGPIVTAGILVIGIAIAATASWVVRRRRSM